MQMTPPWVLNHLQMKMSYMFTDLSLLGKTLVAGDSNSDDQEGHRGMAQLGDSLMGTVILSDGLERGLSREELNDTVLEIRSKKFCGRIAKVLRLHEWIKPSERQMHIGIQPTTLKNAVAALIGAVWLDSHDYKAVLRVMISIGLLNHAQYCDELQDTLLMDVDPNWGFDDLQVSYNEIGSCEKDHIDGDYWSLLPEHDRNLEKLFQVQSTCGPSPTVESASTAAPASPVRTLEYTPPSSPDSLRRGEVQDYQAPLTASASCGGNNAPAMPGPGVQDLAARAQQRLGEDKPSKTGTRGDGRVTKRNTRRGKVGGPGRPGADSPACIIETYVSHEREKAITLQDHACIANVMKAYQTAILQAPARCQRSLAILATSIGDSSALLLLKEAIQGLRSPQVGDVLYIDRRMSISERIDVIEKVGACTALLRLVRLLHIVTLWEDLSRMVGDSSDRFIVVTPDSVALHTTRKGNPRNLARTEVAQGLADPHGSQHGSSQDGEVQKNTRLRRLGQRLSLIVRTWGQGVLLILGQDFSEARILASTDQTFDALIALIDQHEGPRISAVSATALPTLQDFRRGNQMVARLRLESVDEDVILSLSRLSTGSEALLGPSDEE